VKPLVPPPIVALVAALAMWALDRWFPLDHWLSFPLQRLGSLPAVVGFAVASAAFMSFRRVHTTVNPLLPDKATHLVTEGVFGMTRNPMYLGLLLVLLGWAIWLGSIAPLFVLPAFWVMITYAQIIPEEHALGKVFGEDYAAYRRKVNRWLGRRRAQRRQGARP